MVHAGPRLTLYFLNGKLQHLATSWWKLAEISHFCSCYTISLVQEQKYLKSLARNKLADPSYFAGS